MKPVYKRGPCTVTADELGPKLKGYLESGFVLRIGEVNPPKEVNVVANDSVRALDSKEAHAPLTRPDEVGGAREPKLGRKLVQKDRFDIEPRALKGKTLEELNLMIVERDPSVGQARTIEDAVKILSQELV